MPVGATTATFQLHDGNFIGTKDCGTSGKNSLCAGGAGGTNCSPLGGVCEVTIDLSTAVCTKPEIYEEPECVSDELPR